MNLFDKQLGKDFLSSVPPLPGVYRVYDQHEQFIYVGKAKNLRRRLSQYRNAKRRKKHKKMRTIIQHAAQVRFEVCPTELDAELLETQLIQTHRPKWNTAGAFYFLYPMIGMKWCERKVYFCYTTSPDQFEGFEFHGAFRSRDISREAYFALVKLLRFVGHPESAPKDSELIVPKYSSLYAFRQLPEDWKDLWTQFWRGESKTLLEELSIQLLENAAARKKSADVQELLKILIRFWRHEAVPLFKARQKLSYLPYPVSQLERDVLFLKYRKST